MSQGVTRLRELLFDEESARIDGVDDRVRTLSQRIEAVEDLTEKEQRERLATLRQVEQLFERAGTEQRFATSVASVMDRALEEAEVKRHAQVSRAIAPLVVSTIKTELKNSQDEMVQVLYPITGRLVQAYVASAMKDLADQINRRLSQNPLSLRWRSIRTGVPVSDLVLADTERLVVDEVYLIRRGSGELLGRWPGGTELSNQDIHMSGVLSAINEFATNAFEVEGGNLRSFRADDFQFYLRASPMYLLAARCRGTAPASVEQVFDEEFVSFLSQSVDQPLLAPPDLAGDESGSDTPSVRLGVLAEDLAEEVDARYEKLSPPSNSGATLKVLAALILLPLIGWIGWTLFTNWEASRTRQLAQSAIQSTEGMRGYPTELSVGYRGRSLSLSGLAPTADVRSTLLTKLRGALPETTEVETRLAVLPAAELPPPAEPVDLEPLAREVRSVETRLIRQALARSLRRTERRLRQARDELQAFASNASDASRRQAADAALKPAGVALDRLAGLNAQILSRSTSLSDLEGTAGDIRTSINNVDRSYAEIAELLGGGSNVSTLSSDADRSDAESKASATDLASDLSASAERLASTIAAVRQAGSLRLPQPAAPQIVRETVKLTPEDRLALFVRRNAIFFANGAAFRSPQAVAQQLDTLAARIKATDILVRIVGYTDERGGLDRNNSLALERAQTVRNELLDRGVAERQLVAVGRASIRDLSPTTGSESPNRRVEFELGFIGESPQAPR